VSDKKATNLFDRSQLILAGVVVAMLISFVALACVPDARRLDRINRELSEEETKWEMQRAQIEILPDVAKRVEELRVRFASQQGRVPEEANLPQFLGAVAKILTDEGARQHDLVPQQSRVAEKYIEVPIDVKFEASFRGAFRILARLEHLDRINLVESLKLTRGSGDSEWIAVDMRVIVYYAQPTAEGPQVARAG
jgi:Tfp pilus assembly protein PilO